MSLANVAKLSPNAQSSNAPLLPSKASGFARLMAGGVLALKPKLVDNVALKLKPSMDARPARREPSAA